MEKTAEEIQVEINKKIRITSLTLISIVCVFIAAIMFALMRMAIPCGALLVFTAILVFRQTTKSEEISELWEKFWVADEGERRKEKSNKLKKLRQKLKKK